MIHRGIPSTLAILLLCASGCAQSGGLLSQRTTVGTLKASLSHLDYENQQLRRQVASLEADNRRVEDRLVQEQAVNGELSARLDDARNLLSDRGSPSGEVDLGSLPRPSRNTLPAGQSSQARRKPPFAVIPGRVELKPDPLRPAPKRPEYEYEPGYGLDPRPSGHEDDGPQSRLDRSRPWLPVVGGVMEASPIIRR